MECQYLIGENSDLASKAVQNYVDNNTPNAHAKLAVYPGNGTPQIVSDYGVQALATISDIPKSLKGRQVLYGTSQVITDANGAGWIPFAPNFKDDNMLFLAGAYDTNVADRVSTAPKYNGVAVLASKNGTQVANNSNLWLTWIAIGAPL